MSYPVLRLPSLEMPRLKTSFLFSSFLAMVALFGLASRVDAQCSGAGTVTYNSTGGVSVTASGITTSTNTITVPSLPAGSTITCISVVLNGVTSDGAAHSSMEHAAFMLTSPTPNQQKFEFLGATGDGTDGDDLNDSGSGLLNAKITVADNAGAEPPENSTHWTPQNGTFVVKPGSFYISTGLGNPPLPVGGVSSQWATLDGSATFASSFTTGATPSGGWTLSLTDNNTAADGPDPVSVTSWSLVMTTVATSNVNTTTTLTSNINPSFTSGGNSTVTLTATVTATPGSPTGTVLFTDGGNNLSCGGVNPVPLSSRVATCNTTFSTEGVHTLSAAYGGTTGFNPSTGTANQLVENPTTHPGGDEYCNTGGLTNNGETTSPYPSIINVPSLGGTVANVSVTLNGFSGTGGVPLDYGLLLVAPDDTHNLDFLDDAGVGEPDTFSENVTIADGGASAPENGGLTSGTYGPTVNSTTAPSFPGTESPAPQVPGAINYAQPDLFGPGAMTLAQAFDGVSPAGAWSLFLLNNSGSGTPLNLTGGWCLSFTVNNGSPTTTTLASTENPAFVGDSVTLTATVKSGGSPVTSGTVAIIDTTTGTTLANSSLNGSGTVQVSVSNLAEGDHNITASYSGVNNEFDPSQGNLWQRMDTRSTVTGAGSSASPAVYCNPAGITVPNQASIADSGAAAPNPTNIFVSNLPGTVNSVQMELENFRTPAAAGGDAILWTSTMLVAPAPATNTTHAEGFNLFTGTGLTSNDTFLALGNYILADTGSEPVPQANYGPGTYQPASYSISNVNNTFTASPSGFYTLPGSVEYAEPHGTSTFASLYNDNNPNGVWSLYFNQNTTVDGPGSTATGWCLSFIENLPIVQITAAHGGGNFTQGETNAPITVDIANQGPGSTGDASGSNPIKVVDVLNPAFTFASGSGSGWTCSASSQTVTCTNDDSVASGSSYPTLTIDVNVSATAGSPISNTATAIGGTGGILGTATSTDSITVNPEPVLSVSKTAVGTFKQGATGQWNIVVSNIAASGATSGTVTVSDTMPSGYTVTSIITGANWNCTSSTSTVVTCTSTAAVAGGASFQTITVNANIPANSATSVTNTANAWGGGDSVHPNSSNPATGFSTVTVVQTPATVAVSAGNNQSAPVGTAFATNLAVTVKDANSVAINGATVTFTAPVSGASGTFTSSNTATTNAAGLATANVFTANGTPGTYTVGAATGSATASFSLTNTQAPSITSANNTTFTQNSAGTFTVTTTGTPTPALSETGTLPANVTFTDNGNGTATIAGTSISAGSFPITITASNGVSPNATQSFTLTVNAATVQVPSVVGDTLAAATTAINGAGLVVGTTTSQYSPTVPAGEVISQNPGSGQTVNIGSAVNLVLSNGPQPVLNSIQVTSGSSTSSVGGAFSFTVTAYDQFSNVFTGYTGTVTFSSTDATATRPANYTFTPGDAGTHNFSITFNSAGNWTITATDTINSIAGTSGSITVSVPGFVVTNTNDAGSGSLRAALASAATAGSGNITFDPSDFSTAQTINVASTLTVPSNTTITGPTSGSGATLTNLVTVSGGGSSTDYPVFTVNTGTTGASISGLIITNGNVTGNGGGIMNSGALTLTNSTLTGNNSGRWGGGVYSNGPITISGTTMNNNSASVQAGALLIDGTTATITNSTFTLNTSFYAGGIYNVHGTVNLKGVTVAGNHASFSTNDLYDLGSLTIANTVIGDLTSLNGPADNGGNVTGNTGLNLAPLGNYGGPTQTMIPLPGSTAICAGTTTNWNALNPSADQRGIATSDPNCASGAVDSGAVQSNYSISVSTDASNVMVNTAMSPAPAIQLDESGSAFIVTATPLPTVTIPLTLTGAGALTGGSANIDDSTGIATYSGLQIDTAAMHDKLTANLTLTSGISPAVVLSTTTSSFEVLGAASSMTANAGTTPQSTTIGTAFPQALAVTVVDSANDPVQGASVTFTAPGSGASGKFSNSTATITVQTGSNGIASAPFTANTTAGANYIVTASTSGATTVNFTLTNTAGAASSMTANAGTTPQSTTVNTAFANALAVTVEDASSNPISGVNVTFTVPSTGASGKLFGTSTTFVVGTNANGIASAPITANSTAGAYTATASAAGLTTVNFSLTNTAGAASSMMPNVGTTPQTTTVLTAFGNALAVTVEDASSNPVSGVSVTFTAPGSGASGKFSNSTATITVSTNASGIASAPFTANSTAGGPYSVSATSAGLTAASFSLTNTAGAASSMTANVGTTPQTTTVGTAFTNALAVTVEDASSNPVSGVSVTFTAPGSGASGKFSNSTATITVSTNSSGIASAPITANSTAGGPYTVSATSAGLTAASFSLTNTAGAASTMTANAGTTPQTTTVNTAFANALAVTVLDASSNPVPGVNVTFTTPSTGASGKLFGTSTTFVVGTNANGIASAPITANTTAGGPYTATASAAGLTTVSFSLTNTAGAASSMAANAGATPQSALVNAAFANALAVTVKDAFSNPVSGVSVTFTGPASGAGGTFSNSTNSIMATTNASGVASGGTFTANATPGGPYMVSATAAGVTAVNFSLTNTPASLSVTCSPTNSGMVNVALNSGGENVTGGVMPYTFYLGSGAIPNGLMLNTTNGAVSGTPATSGAFSISVKDSANTVAATSCPFTITAPALVVTWATPAAITYGTELSVTQLDAMANEPGSFSYSPAAGTLLTAGSHQLSATFTPSDTKDYKVTTAHVTQVVDKATPVVSWSPAPLQIGSKLTSAQLDATANVPGKFVYTPALGTEITSSTETLKVVFTPTDTTDYNSVTKTVSLEVTVITVSPLSLNFGTVYLDSITTKDVTVSNLGSVPVNVSTPLISILTAGDSREFVAVNLCLQPLQPHKSCTIQVSYVAGPFYHQQTASMSVKYNSAGSPQTVSLTALTIDPEATLSASGLSFGKQKEGTSSAAKTITLTNPGATALTIDSVTVTGSDPHDFLLTNHCSSSLAAGSSCTIGVTFKPGAKGSRSAKLEVKDNAKNSPQSATLTGTGD